MKLLRWLTELLYPPKCVFCRRLLRPEEQELCAHCRTSLPEAEQCVKRGAYYSACISVYYYEEAVADSVRRFKFRGMRQYAAAYGRLIAMQLLRRRVEFDVLSWVPVSDKRRRERGYDQTLLIAQSAAAELGVPCVQTLKKVLNNPPQSLQPDAAARRANVINAYRAVEPERFCGKRVLLIDDVISTGATLSECSHTLRRAGAASVVGATLAAARLH